MARRATTWPSLSPRQKPTVDFSLRRPQLKFHRVLEDHAHAAKLVADHSFRAASPILFLQRCGQLVLRGTRRGFIHSLKEPAMNVPGCAGIFGCLCVRTRGRRKKRKWLAAQIESGAKPLAVFAATISRRWMSWKLAKAPHCRAGTGSIVGAENYLLAPDSMRTPISSVDTNLETLGYRGAELLDKLMAGKTLPADPIRIPAVGVVARKSSDILTISTLVWPKACASSGSTAMNDLRQGSGGSRPLSRRGLHKAFLEHLGRTRTGTSAGADRARQEVAR